MVSKEEEEISQWRRGQKSLEVWVSQSMSRCFNVAAPPLAPSCTGLETQPGELCFWQDSKKPWIGLVLINQLPRASLNIRELE